MSDTLTAMDVAGRIGRLRAHLAADALVVTSLTNIRYLTGFTGSAARLVVTADGPITFITDGRYATQSAEELAAAAVDAAIEVAPAARQGDALKDAVGPVGRLALEAEHLSWAAVRRYGEAWFAGIELVPTVGLVEGLRVVKDAGEVARLARAAALADAALREVRGLLAEEPTELAFARHLDGAMREAGASGPSFDTIVASGPNGAKPHHQPGGRRIRADEPIVLDFGARFDGYCSDMTRTVWVDTVADPELRRVVEVVRASQAAGVGAVRAGVAAAEVDRACREVIAASGWGEQFVHGTGHGVGLDIHEAPAVAATSLDTLTVGQVVTVEPGIYLPGIGGVRIEDTVVVTADGCDPLTRTPKDC